MRFPDCRIVLSRCALALLAAVFGLAVTQSGLAQTATQPVQDGTDRSNTTSLAPGLSGRNSSQLTDPYRNSPASRRTGVSSTPARTGATSTRAGAGATSTRAGAGATSARTRGGATPPIRDAQLKQTVVRRQTRAAGAPSGGGGTPLPGLKLLPGIKEDALYLDPPQARVAVGDRFVVKLDFFNNSQAPVDTLDLWVKFPPGVLEPVWIDLEPIADNLTTPTTPSVWPESGYLHLTASLKRPLTETINPVARMHWRSLSPTLGARIDLAAPTGEQVALLADGRNVIAPSGIGNRARVSSLVRAAAPGEADEYLLMDQDVRERMTSVDLDPQSRVRLAIITPSPFAGAGEVATADVVLINPNNQPLDTLRLLIRYDPHSVLVLDADDNNYISKGINLFDGDFHHTHPFDVHTANRVEPTIGRIRYEMGTSVGAHPYASGTVARIVYRLQRQAGQTAFWFERVDPLRGVVGTDVSINGVSLLGETDDAASKALHGARVMVRPLDLAVRDSAAAPATAPIVPTP